MLLLLGVVLIALLRAGASLFAVEKAFGRWGEAVMAPLLFLVGLYLLFGERLPLPKIGFRGQGEGLVRRGGWGALLLGLLGCCGIMLFISITAGIKAVGL